jgi:hypothetical protein
MLFYNVHGLQTLHNAQTCSGYLLNADVTCQKVGRLMMEKINMYHICCGFQIMHNAHTSISSMHLLKRRCHMPKHKNAAGGRAGLQVENIQKCRAQLA